jgi:hypothetical protein
MKEKNMTKRQRMHKKLIKIQNRMGKVDGRSTWNLMKKEASNGASA